MFTDQGIIISMLCNALHNKGSLEVCRLKTPTHPTLRTAWVSRCVERNPRRCSVCKQATCPRIRCNDRLLIVRNPSQLDWRIPFHSLLIKSLHQLVHTRTFQEVVATDTSSPPRGYLQTPQVRCMLRRWTIKAGPKGFQGSPWYPPIRCNGPVFPTEASGV